MTPLPLWFRRCFLAQTPRCFTIIDAASLKYGSNCVVVGITCRGCGSAKLKKAGLLWSSLGVFDLTRLSPKMPTVLSI